MAGFLDTIGVNQVRNRLVKLSKFGMDYNDLLLKNSQAIGFIEGEMRKRSLGVGSDDMFRYSMAISDTTSQLKTKTLAFFQLDYLQKREKLRDLAANSEIEFVLDMITDDSIVYDDDNKFCKPKDLRGELVRQKGVQTKKDELEYEDNIIDSYHENFNQIYTAWGFNVGISAWQYFFQWLIEGHLAFEIIYDNLNKPKKIIGFKELDPATLFPIVKKDGQGNMFLEWLQRDDAQGLHRTLTDAQIIYLSYSNFFRTKRVSFIERMIRSFNLLRIIEHSKVIWHVMNAPIRLKTEVPIGSKSLQKAKEDLNEFVNTFKEDIHFNNASGELEVDGQPKILFYKNYVVPVNDRGEKVDISAIEFKGPDLQENSLLTYFLKKLKLDSKLPFSRWDYNEGGGTYLLGQDTVNREEITFDKFLRRLRVAYQELIMKPWYLQMCLDHDALKTDLKFKNAMGIIYHNENIFEKLKTQELLKKGAETIAQLKELKKPDGTDFFATEYLVREHLNLSEEDLKQNQEYLQLETQGGGEAGGSEEAGGLPGAEGESGGAPAAEETEESPLAGLTEEGAEE